MKRKELKDFENKTTSDIKKKIVELEKELVATRIELKMAKVKNVHLLRPKRKDIARLKTIAREKELAGVTKNVTS